MDPDVSIMDPDVSIMDPDVSISKSVGNYKLLIILWLDFLSWLKVWTKSI